MKRSIAYQIVSGCHIGFTLWMVIAAIVMTVMSIMNVGIREGFTQMQAIISSAVYDVATIGYVILCNLNRLENG